MRTRFRIRQGRTMHLGHVLVVLHNHTRARGERGQFVFILDDIGAPEDVPDTQDQWRTDLEWLGLMPDLWVRSSACAEEHRQRLIQIGMDPRTEELRDGIAGTINIWGAMTDLSYQAHPMAPGHEMDDAYPVALAVEVLDDERHQITHVVMGQDKLHQHALYSDLSRRLYTRPPVRTYEPTVARSKPSQACRTPVAALREAGYAPQHILTALTDCYRVARIAESNVVLLPYEVLNPNVPAEAETVEAEATN